jgi:hypothetical protein
MSAFIAVYFSMPRLISGNNLNQTDIQVLQPAALQKLAPLNDECRIKLNASTLSDEPGEHPSFLCSEFTVLSHDGEFSKNIIPCI